MSVGFRKAQRDAQHFLPCGGCPPLSSKGRPTAAWIYQIRARHAQTGRAPPAWTPCYARAEAEAELAGVGCYEDPYHCVEFFESHMIAKEN